MIDVATVDSVIYVLPTRAWLLFICGIVANKWLLQQLVSMATTLVRIRWIGLLASKLDILFCLIAAIKVFSVEYFIWVSPSP